MADDGPDLEFPLYCHYKIIAETSSGIRGRIEKVLLELDIVEPLIEGSHSEKGRYVTYNVKI